MSATNFWVHNGIKFIPSTNVKVFPCAYRGYDDNSNIFNPEASAFSEKNFTNIYSKSRNKESFIISWEEYTPKGSDIPYTLLKCVIGGYYFEIKDVDINDFYDKNRRIIYKLVINLKELSISENDTTYILKSLIDENENVLDTLASDSGFAGYYFVGLALAEENDPQSYDYALSPCREVEDDVENDKEQTYRVEINWRTKQLDTVLAPDTGHSSLKMLGEVVNGLSGACEATGDYAVALGERTLASGKHAVALGELTIASEKHAIALGVASVADAEDAVAIGNKAVSTHKGSFALGEEVKTGDTNQVIIGYKTTADANDAFVIGNDGKKLAVDKDGNLRLIGNIIAAGNGTNYLKLGDIKYNNGSIAVYGDLKTAVENYEKLDNEATYDPNETYYIFEHDEFIEEVVKEEDFETKKNTLYIRSDIEREKVFDLNKDGDLTVTGDVELKETLHVIKDINGDKDINGHGNLTISSGGSTHTLTLGSTGINDAGKIDLYGWNTNKTVFTVSNKGVINAAGTITSSDNLVTEKKLIADEGAEIYTANSPDIPVLEVTEVQDTPQVNINGPLNIKNDLKVLIDDNNSPKFIIDDKEIKYNENFLVTKEGQIAATELIISKQIDDGTWTTIGGIDADGKITGNSLQIGASSLGGDNDMLVMSGGISIFKQEKKAISFDNKTYNIKDINANGEIHNTNALAILNNLGESNQICGVHITNRLSLDGDFIIGETWTEGDAEIEGTTTTKITQGGIAYFRQGLLIGGTATTAGATNDTVVFRVRAFDKLADGKNAATLKGDLNIEKYNNNSYGGNINVKGSINVGTIIINGEDNLNNISGIGKITAEAFNATSDIRKKTNIKDYYCKRSILDLPIKEFEFIDDETHTKHIGCIAQDLQEICPELVHEDTNGYLAIEENKLVYLLLQEVKELKKEIKSLKGE